MKGEDLKACVAEARKRGNGAVVAVLEKAAAGVRAGCIRGEMGLPSLVAVFAFILRPEIFKV